MLSCKLGQACIKNTKSGGNKITKTSNVIRYAVPYTMTCKVKVVDRVVYNISIQVCITSIEQNRVSCCPSRRNGIVIPCSEPDEAGGWLVDSSGEAERLELGIGVGEHSAELVVGEFLNHGAGGLVDDEAGAS